MVEVVYNAIDNKCYAKQDGKWVPASFEQVVKTPANDVITETPLSIAQKAFAEADNALKSFIVSMKADIAEKKELAELSLETAQSVEAKKSYYKPLYEALKADYDTKKAELKALL